MLCVEVEQIQVRTRIERIKVKTFSEGGPVTFSKGEKRFS